MSAWATLKTCRRSTRSARSCISAADIPEAQAAPISDAHAGADHQIGREAALLEGAEHADVGQALEAAATEHQGKLGRLFHRLPRPMTVT